MLKNSVCRSIGILVLTAALLGPTIHHAGGQVVNRQAELGVPQPTGLSVAFQPGVFAAQEEPPAPPPPELDPRAPRPTQGPPDRLPPSSMLAARGPIVRLAGMPNMYGDSLANCGQITAYGYSGGYEPSYGLGYQPGYDGQEGEYDYFVVADLPCAAGGATMKMAENDKAMPMDRLIFMYNHYENALYAAASPVRPYSIDRFTIGAEKTFLGGRCSVEVRLPLNDVYRFTATDFRLKRGEIGNLGLAYKHLLWMNESTSIAAGLGIDLPTGSDVTGRAGVSDFALYNDAVHLLPFIGFLRAPNDLFFYQGFLQLDIPANGNPVVFGGDELGKLTEQNLLFVDFSLGRWLWRDPCACRLRGLAAVVEFHYTTTLQDADAIAGYVGNDYLELRNLYNRTDVSNVTVGLYGEIGQTEVRVGGVFPLQDRPDRYFDAEVQLSVNRRF